MRVAIATCTKLPEPDPDEPLLLAALKDHGVESAMLPWDDERAPFADHDLVVVRSTWNYFEHVDAFVAWATRTASKTPLLNPPRIIAWNARKTYLAELEARDVAIVPTEFVPQGTKRQLDDILRERGWDDVVIKPVVSAGSFRTERFSRGNAGAGQVFLDGLVAPTARAPEGRAGLAEGRDAMVQRWMPSVDTYGERSLVWIDGAVTHAIRKTPRFAGGSEQVSGAVDVSTDELAFAEHALSHVASELLYARVDMVRDGDGTLRIMELELIEPSLFFQQSPSALQRFAAAIAKRGRDERR